MKLKRGALIVIEGVDRTGKSTQAKSLVESLKKKQVKAEYTNFPARYTEIGKVINNYLTSKTDLSNETIHLLFSANRWETAKNIIQTLEQGTSIIVDRYCYSGVAFSAAKGLDIDWCKAPDRGLPKPDKVFFLTMPLENVMQRNGFGNERYEVPEFQNRVSEMYTLLKDDSWEVLDASRSIKDIHEELLQKTFSIINTVGEKPIGKVWLD
ncbi:thymidylate kinase [Pectinophora gossypiella]|uniref:thymidylate kinase n=1 Tax=Pectinophora gossypiella TaxID=13191 RepID=UPI00214E47F5|nr:thymidylate kinase [Pectinophora gossypiella]